MKLTAQTTDNGPVVTLGETETGLLYRYDFRYPGKPRVITIYVLACQYQDQRIFADLATGDFYNGDRGELRLLDQAELILGRQQ